MAQIADVGPPAIVANAKGRSPIVLVCDHASNYIPAVLDGLGLSEADRAAHIAWDIGAEPVARQLSRLLDAPLVLQRYSRLVYDCNRPPESPDAMREMSEVTAIPGNMGLSQSDRQARVDEIYRPFHAMVGDVLDDKQRAGLPPVLVTVHSFTPAFKGSVRTLELGILHDDDSRLADVMLDLVARTGDYSALRNEPYGPQDGVTHALQLHGVAKGLHNVMLEIRNDLITDDAGQTAWAERLAVLLNVAVSRIDNRPLDRALAVPS